MGTGEMNADLNLVNVRLSRGSQMFPAKITWQMAGLKNLKVKYKTPLSMALGATRQFGKVRMYGGINWFTAIKKYAVLDPGEASFIQPVK